MNWGADGRVCKSSSVLEDGDNRDFATGRGPADIGAVGPAKHKSIYARRSGGFCAKELSCGACFAGACVLGGSRCERGPHELLASNRSSLAVQSRDRQQHCRVDATKLRHRPDYGTGDVVAVEPQRLGKRGWPVVFMGASRLRISWCEGGCRARRSAQGRGGSVIDPPRCRHCDGGCVPHTPGGGKDRPCRRGGCRAPRNLHEVRARPCGQSTSCGCRCIQGGRGTRPRPSQPCEGAAAGSNKPRATRGYPRHCRYYGRSPGEHFARRTTGDRSASSAYLHKPRR